MAALATLAACDGSHINDKAHLKAASSSSHASPQPSSKTSLDEGQEMFAYLDESELIDAYYEVKWFVSKVLTLSLFPRVASSNAVLVIIE